MRRKGILIEAGGYADFSSGALAVPDVERGEALRICRRRSTRAGGLNRAAGPAVGPVVAESELPATAS